MAVSMWDPALRATFAERVKKLNRETKGAWGKFTATGMLAHLNDSYRMCTDKAYGVLMARHTEHHFRQFGL